MRPSTICLLVVLFEILDYTCKDIKFDKNPNVIRQNFVTKFFVKTKQKNKNMRQINLRVKRENTESARVCLCV